MSGMDYYDYYGGGYTTLQGTASASTTDVVWPNWVQGPLSFYGTATWYGTDTGTIGNGDTVTLGGQILEAAWQSWTVTVRVDIPPVVPETPEARQAREARQVEWAAQQAKQAEESKAAKECAERLLVEHLSQAQRAAYERDRFFEVVAAKSRYRIYHDGSVRRLGEDGREVASYCIHPDEAIPAGDLALAKKLLLETDEVAFRRIANESLIVGGVRA